MTDGPGADRPTYAVVGQDHPWSGRVSAVRIDHIVMPGGKIADREVVEHDAAVAVVALEGVDGDGTGAGDTDGPTIVLIEQYRSPVRRRLWELPAGLMDIDGEPAHLTAARELLEETGYAADHWSVLLDVATSPGFTDEMVRIYLATGLRQVGRPDAGEHEEAEIRVVHLPLDDAVAAALDGRIVNVMAVAGILAARAVLDRGVPPRGIDDPAPGLPFARVDRGPTPDGAGPVPSAPALTDGEPSDPAAASDRARG